MNISKRLVPIFCILLVLFAVSIANGCSRKNESNVKDVVKNEEIMRYSLLKSENEEKYDFNEILEYYYLLGKIDTEDIRICKLITSNKNEF